MERKILVVANRKGGVGKTTVTFNLAHTLADQGHRVLIVDLDSQANQTKLCKAKVQDLEAFKEAKSVAVAERISIVPATKQLGKLEGEVNTLFDRNGYIRDEFLKKIPEAFDFVIFDTPPSLSLMNVNAFCAADMAVIIVNPDTFSIDGLVETKKILSQAKTVNPKLAYKVVLNMFTKTRTLTKQTKVALVADPGWSGVEIPDKQHFKDCNALKKPSLDNSEIAEEFLRLAEVVG